MGSTNFTEHYDIPLPLGSDKTTPMDYNQSMQAVDTALFTAQGDATDAKTGLATTNLNVAQNAQDISALAGRVTTAEGTISSQGTAITNLGTKVDGVEQNAQDMICAYNQASATASRNYSVGDYFIYNDVLYRVTQTIASGGTIVPDTNCTTTNVTSEIKQIVGDIGELESDLQVITDLGQDVTGDGTEHEVEYTVEDNVFEIYCVVGFTGGSISDTQVIKKFTGVQHLIFVVYMQDSDSKPKAAGWVRFNPTTHKVTVHANAVMDSNWFIAVYAH